MGTKWIGSAVAALLMLSAARAEFSQIDDFESYSVASWSGGSTASAVWTANNGGSTGLVAVEDDGDTQHLAFGWGSGMRGAIRTVTPIVNGACGTYYFRIRTEDSTPDISWWAFRCGAGRV